MAVQKPRMESCPMEATYKRDTHTSLQQRHQEDTALRDYRIDRSFDPAPSRNSPMTLRMAKLGRPK